VFVMTAKTYDTDAALAPLSQARVARAFSVQNGIVKDDQLAAVFGRAAVLGCTANFSGEVQTDGSVAFTRNQGLYIGELPSGVSPRVIEIAEAFTAAGIDTIAEPEILRLEWSKLIPWLPLTAVAVLSRLETHRFFMDPDLARLEIDLLHECMRLADALGQEVIDIGGLAQPR